MYDSMEAAFNRCPPYGLGAFGYEKEDIQILEEMRTLTDSLFDVLDWEKIEQVNQLLRIYRRYMERCYRYYFYRGTLHGTDETLAMMRSEEFDIEG